MKTLKLEFDSVAALVNYANGNPYINSYAKNYKPSELKPYTYEDTCKAALAGWPEGVKEFDGALQAIKAATGETMAAGVAYDVQGDFLDVGRFLDGEPECFGQMVMEPTPQDVVRIGVNISCPFFVLPNQITNRGAAIAALIDRLLPHHFVELHIVAFSVKLPGNSALLTTINFDTRHLYSIDLLAFALGHVGMLRRLMFSAWERFYKKADLSYCLYGHTEKPPAEILAQWDIYFSGITGKSEYSTPQAAWEEATRIASGVGKK